jgi:hypothetical protein
MGKGKAADIDSRDGQAEVTDITVGLRVPHELPGGARGLREFVARAEATGVDRLFTGDHVMFKGGRGLPVVQPDPGGGHRSGRDRGSGRGADRPEERR